MTSTAPRVVLVHGLWFPVSFMLVLKKRLEASGFVVQPFNYQTTRQTIQENARALFKACEALPGETVHLLGHSLGGLLILQMVHQSRWTRDGRLLFLGSPLQGSIAARRASKWPGGDVLLGYAGDPLNEGTAAWPDDRVTGMISGSRPYGLGLMTGRMARPNDGTVTLAETLHPGLSAHIELPVTHTGMLYSPAVARQSIQFLKKGGFNHDSGRLEPTNS